jgi:hypothetical protein
LRYDAVLPRSKYKTNMDTFCAVAWLTLNSVHSLTEAITAFAILRDEHGAERSGAVCEIEEGADLRICGPGFNTRTVKVCYGDALFYVFWRDLALAVTHAQADALEAQVGLRHLAASAAAWDFRSREMTAAVCRSRRYRLKVAHR